MTVWVRQHPLIQSRINLDTAPPGDYWRHLRHATQQLLLFMPAARWPLEARFKITNIFKALDAMSEFVNQISGRHITIKERYVAPEQIEIIKKAKWYVSPIYLDLGS